MKLLEYEAKQLLKEHGAPLPVSRLLISEGSLTDTLQLPVVLKSQVPIGGRGKAGGIRTAQTEREVQQLFNELLQREIYGFIPTAILAEEALEIKRELYLALTIDSSAHVMTLVASKEGGIDIEANSQGDQSSLLKLPLTAQPTSQQIEQLRNHLELPETLRESLEQVIASLWMTFTIEDALLVEINPLVLTKNLQLVCADAKIELDPAAAFRHSARGFEDKQQSHQFVVLDQQGRIGAMANGAGLAMATVDAIAATSERPANFLDIGGGTNVEGMINALGEIAKLPKVEAIVINIFAGITRCDEVAQAVIGAREHVEQLPPLFIRLAGTNEAEGKRILQDARIAVLPSLDDCIKAAVEEVQNV
ncbi:hypothetical protein CYG49_02575 [Candidatus Saccharibacteria bacterium]|nr:MAG: hypothetical protein CYG49_02575 [Candidatus Saccharibacteria bacterium]